MNLLSHHISVVPNWLWVSFCIGVLILLFIDLSLFGKNHKVEPKKALIESGLWISVALIFNVWFYFEYGHDLGIEFLTSYLVEKSLSVDNLFVILLIFSSFRVPDKYHHKILFYGILGAIILRGFFIILGAHLLNTFSWILYVFGAFLLITAVKILVESDKEEDMKENIAVRIVKKFFPTTPHFDSGKFFVIEDGVRKMTPLFLALIVIEFTDLVFAVDSIPAVFAVTKDGFVAFASNILAILGLRALYFVLSDWVSRLRYLKPGLAAILAFIGVKMLISDFYHIPSTVSLMVIFFILLTAGLGSWYAAKVEMRKKRDKDPLENK